MDFAQDIWEKRTSSSSSPLPLPSIIGDVVKIKKLITNLNNEMENTDKVI